MQVSNLRTRLLMAGLCLALASCSIFDESDRSPGASSEPVLQQGNSRSSPPAGPVAARQPRAEAWPGPNVGAPLPITGAAAQGGGTGVAENRGPSGVERAPLPSPPGSDGFSGGSINPSGLVDVNLNRVRRHVARYLNVDASRIPATIALPVTVAAGLCGVDAKALTAQPRPGGKPSCIANNAGMATDVLEPTIQ